MTTSRAAAFEPDWCNRCDGEGCDRCGGLSFRRRLWMQSDRYPDTRGPWVTENRMERHHRPRRDDTSPVHLPPPEAFPDDYTPPGTLLQYRPGADPAETGPRSRTIRIVIHRRCCGWRTRPTPQEVYDTMRAEEPTPRQVEVMTVVLNSATFDEMLLAHLEGAFTWRQAARAMHLHHCSPPERARQLARFARRDR